MSIVKISKDQDCLIYEGVTQSFVSSIDTCPLILLEEIIPFSTSKEFWQITPHEYFEHQNISFSNISITILNAVPKSQIVTLDLLPVPETVKVIYNDELSHWKKFYHGLTYSLHNNYCRFANYTVKKIKSEVSNASATTFSHIFTSAISDSFSKPFEFIFDKYFGEPKKPSEISLMQDGIKSWFTENFKFSFKDMFSSLLGSLGFFFGKSVLNVVLEHVMKEYTPCYEKPEEESALKSILCNKMTYFLAIDSAIIGFEIYTGGLTKFALTTSGKFAGYFLSYFIIDGFETNNFIEPVPLQDKSDEFSRDGVTSTRLFCKQGLDFLSYIRYGDSSSFKKNSPFLHKVASTSCFYIGFEYILRSKDVNEALNKVYAATGLNIVFSVGKSISNLNPFIFLVDIVNFKTNSLSHDLNNKFVISSEILPLKSKKEFSSLVNKVYEYWYDSSNPVDNNLVAQDQSSLCDPLPL